MAVMTVCACVIVNSREEQKPVVDDIVIGDGNGDMAYHGET